MTLPLLTRKPAKKKYATPTHRWQLWYLKQLPTRLLAAWASSEYSPALLRATAWFTTPAAKRKNVSALYLPCAAKRRFRWNRLLPAISVLQPNCSLPLPAILWAIKTPRYSLNLLHSPCRCIHALFTRRKKARKKRLLRLWTAWWTKTRLLSLPETPLPKKL